MGNGRLHGNEGRRQVQFDPTAKIRQVEIGNIARLGLAGIVVADFQTPEMLYGPLDDRAHLVGVAQIGRVRHGIRSLRLQLSCQAIQLIARTRYQRQPRAGLCKTPGRCLPDACRGSGDQNDCVRNSIV